MNALRALLATRRARVALLLAAALAVALWQNPVTDHLGYPSALLAALFASVAGAVCGAGLAVSLRTRALPSPASHALAAAGLFPVALVGITALGVLVRGLVAPACGPSQGAVYWLLVALPGAALAGLVGLAFGALTRARGRATLLAALLVPAFIVWSVARFYTSPTIFAYDPFFGFFPGALYDERIPLGLPLVTYRLGTLGWIVAVAALLHARWSPEVSLRGVPWRTRAPSLAVALLGLATGAGVWLAGPSLGHRHSARDIAARLEGEVWSRRCVVWHDRSIDARQARRTARDCDVRVEQLEDFYGVRHPQRIAVFLFANADQKQSLMGAADTYIAKPWRSEVYLQYAPFPHPVLKHELAHVVAAAMAPGPFHITARASLLPVPALVEGAAVAAAWEGESEATPHQWSRAMLEASMAPRVSQLAGLGFFANASVTAYTAAGSFCRWLHDTRGAARFRTLYATGDFEAAYGEPLPALERAWHTFLRTVPTSERTLTRARTRFRRASVFARQCPYELEAVADEAARHLDAGDVARARREYATLVAQDPTDTRHRAGLAIALVRGGDLAAADRVADEAADVLGPAAGNRIRTAIADGVWRWRGGDEALARYDRVDASLLEEDEARTLTLKRATLRAGGDLSEAFRDLLIGRGELDPAPVAAMARLAPMRTPLAAYLVGRQLYQHERFAEALATLDLDLIAQSGDARVFAEARRMIATAQYLSGNTAAARVQFEALARDPARPEGLRDTARDQVDRIDRETRRAAQP